MEAMRALKRRLSDIACHQMITDARATATGPGGHVGAATGSSAAGFNPSTGASEKSLPGPATHDPTPAPGGPIRSSGRPRRPRTTPARSRGQAHFA
jgi:transposase